MVHSHATHPPVVGTGRVSALLVSERCAVGVAYLVPANTCDAVAGVCCVVDDQRPVIAHVSVREPVHKAIVDGMQSVGTVRLIYTNGVLGAKRKRPGSYRYGDRACESGVGGADPVCMELELMQRTGGAIERLDKVVGTSGGWRRPIQVGRQHAAI